MTQIFWLILILQGNAVVKASYQKKTAETLLRKKREWTIPPKVLQENKDYTHLSYIARIRSDYESGQDIKYSLVGVGASQYPFNVFVVNPKTGIIRVTKILDREEIALYNLSGIAQYRDGTHAEEKIDVFFRVGDENDNSPVFGENERAGVHEHSPAGTMVMKITATDADEPGNENSQIMYTLIEQKPAHDMFYIISDGTLYVKKPSLDREIEDQYILKVRGQDLNGKAEGHVGTGTVTIDILDVNDNPPTLEKDEYVGAIEENTKGVPVMTFQAQDLDLNTDNWEAVFDIVKGNEAGYFSIRADPKTNKGTLMLDKAVDYEDVKALDLGIVVRNKAPPYRLGSSENSGGGQAGAGGSGGSGDSGGMGGGSKTYPVKINVKNQPEGPKFDPRVKAISISEGGHPININEIIAHYPANDGDTGKPAEKVSYVKGLDPDNWLSIDPETAAITLNKMPDRESKYLTNGTYYANVLCITKDLPAQTSTGTIAIQVEDSNDHCPVLTTDTETICTTADSVIVAAQDDDSFPNGPPFHFSIVPEGTKSKWLVEHLNDTATILRAQESMWPGFYQVELVVKDDQGQACPEPQKVKIQFCTCEDGLQCGRWGASGMASKETKLGPAGIGILLLGLLMLLLIPLLLLFCYCGESAGFPGGFTEMPFAIKPQLINYHTEGQGENTEVPLLNMPTQVWGEVGKIGVSMAGATSAKAPLTALDSHKTLITMEGNGYSDAYREGSWGILTCNVGSGLYTSEHHGQESRQGRGILDGMFLPDRFLKEYYSDKASCRNVNLAVKDHLLVYDYEGQDSCAGSVGCCSLLESDRDLHFLDDLGLKFKTLAEVCRGKETETDVKSSLCSSFTNTQNSLTSGVNPQQQLTPPQFQPNVHEKGQTFVTNTVGNGKVLRESTATERPGTIFTERIANQGQILLQQQQPPIYLPSTPVLQPVTYVLQPQIQSRVLLTEAPLTKHQGMVLVNEGQNPLSRQVVLSSGEAPGMILVKTGRVKKGISNLINTGNISSPPPMTVMESKVPSGSIKLVKGNQTFMTQRVSDFNKVSLVGGPLPGEEQLKADGLLQVPEALSLVHPSTMMAT